MLDICKICTILRLDRGSFGAQHKFYAAEEETSPFFYFHRRRNALYPGIFSQSVLQLKNSSAAAGKSQVETDFISAAAILFCFLFRDMHKCTASARDLKAVFNMTALSFPA